MKQTLHIAAILDNQVILESLVEQLATRQNDLGFGNQFVPVGQEALETASAMVYTSGAVSMEENNEKFNIPFITSFLFTCVKGTHGNYRLAWSSSLS